MGALLAGRRSRPRRYLLLDTVRTYGGAALRASGTAGPSSAGLPARRLSKPDSPHIPHTLAIAEVYVQLVVAHRAGWLTILDHRTQPAQQGVAGSGGRAVAETSSCSAGSPRPSGMGGGGALPILLICATPKRLYATSRNVSHE